MNNKQTLFAIVFLLVLLGLSSVLASLVPSPTNNLASADEAATRDLSGYAWSSNIGWISFDGSNYGVKFDDDGTGAGALTGYAWANPRDTVAGTNNIGWLNFKPDGPYPGEPNHGAQIESTGSVTGWARFCAGAPNPATCAGGVGANAEAGGWDGWVKMSDSSWNNGTKLGTNANGEQRLEGFAWGGDVVGWINFTPWYYANGTGCSGTNCGTPIFPPGSCNPLHEVCIDNPNTDYLQASCWPDDRNLQLTEGTASTVWHGKVFSGTPPFDYSWSGEGNPTPLTTASTTSKTNDVVVTYNSNGVKSMNLMVRDSSTPRRELSQRCSGAITVGSGDDTATTTTMGTLQVVEGMGVIYIKEQVSGHPAESLVTLSNPWAQIINNGDEGSVVSNLHIESIKSQKTGADLSGIVASASGITSGLEIKCALQTTTSSGPEYKSCDSIFDSLAAGQTAYFRLQIPTYIQEVAAQSPYKVRIVGDTFDQIGTPITSDPADILFQYSVGTYVPQ